MDANDPTDLSLSEAARRIAEGTLTPSALLEACLGRIAATDDAVHAWVSVDEAGRPPPPPRGPPSPRPRGPPQAPLGAAPSCLDTLPAAGPYPPHPAVAPP